MNRAKNAEYYMANVMIYVYVFGDEIMKQHSEV